MRLVRYADDFVVLVHGDRSDAEALFEEVTGVLAPAGLSLSGEESCRGLNPYVTAGKRPPFFTWCKEEFTWACPSLAGLPSC